MKNTRFARSAGALLVAGAACAALVVLAANGLGGVKAITQTSAAPARVAQAEVAAAQINGAYSGAIQLSAVVSGTFSDNLVVPPPPGEGTPTPPDLGSIDLSLQMTQTGSALSGYVSLDKTLVFSAEHTLGAGTDSIQTGPFVSGLFDGTNVMIDSEKVTQDVSGRTVQRQFRMVGVSTDGDGGKVTGEYRETIWGYTNIPITVIGTVTLQRTGFDAIAPVIEDKAPEPVADTAATKRGVAIMINVLANDVNAAGGALTIVSVSNPQFGQATTDGQTVTYTPMADFVGTDTFSYFVRNTQGRTASSSVSVTVGASVEGSSLYLPSIRR